MAEERPRLRPLKATPETLALRIPIWVGPTGMVLHDTHLYSIPPDAMGIAGTLFLYREQVRIVAGRFEATHARLVEPGAKSTLPEHLSTGQRWSRPCPASAGNATSSSSICSISAVRRWPT